MPFGEILMEQSNSEYNNPYKYNGKELDEATGLYYYGARYMDPKTSIWLSVDPLAEKMPSWSPYSYSFDNPVRYVDPDGRAPKDIIITTKNGTKLFTLDDGRKTIRSMTVDQLYKTGTQWFEPTADNYMPLKSTFGALRTSNKINHSTWNEVASFAEEDRWMLSYRPGGSGDWKDSDNPGGGYQLTEMEGVPYWTDAIGQIPFAIDKFTDDLKTTGSAKSARVSTINAGKQFGDGLGVNSDESNSYDIAMIKRATNWAEKRYKAVKEKGLLWDSTVLQKTSHSPKNLSKPSNEKQ